MKTCRASFDGTFDPTGYLFSFVKSLCAMLRSGPYAERADDVIAASGFAFRMWVSPDLCPSATSIWDFSLQERALTAAGLDVTYTERLWGQDSIAAERQVLAIDRIRESIDHGIPAVSWDIGVCEWGLVTGYDNETRTFATLPVTGQPGTMAYEKLGIRELPILNVVTVTGARELSEAEIVRVAMQNAVCHLRGREWCDNAKGLAAYPALYRHLTDPADELGASWNMTYFLGTYAPLKWYAWQFFERHEPSSLATLYKSVWECWNKAFQMKNESDMTKAENRQAVAGLLEAAEKAETKAVGMMEELMPGDPA